MPELFMLSRVSSSCESSDGLVPWVKPRKRPDRDDRLTEEGLPGGVSHCETDRVRITEGLLMAFCTNGGISEYVAAEADREKIARPRHKRMRRDWRIAIRFCKTISSARRLRRALRAETSC